MMATDRFQYVALTVHGRAELNRRLALRAAQGFRVAWIDQTVTEGGTLRFSVVMERPDAGEPVEPEMTLNPFTGELVAMRWPPTHHPSRSLSR